MAGHNQGVLSQLGQAVRRERKTIYQLFFYLIIVGLGSIFTIDLLSIAWANRPWGIVRSLSRWTIEFLGIQIATFYYLPTGLLVGLMGTLLLDSYKRAQGVILWLGIALGGVFILLGKGLLIEPLIEGFTPFAAGFGIIGMSLGFLLGGVRPSAFSQTGSDLEFPKAPRRLFLLAVFIVVYGAIEAIIAYHIQMLWTNSGLIVKNVYYEGLLLNADILLNIVMSGVGLVGLYKFTSYENHTKMILIGPQRSGKSALFGGMQLAVRDVLDNEAGIKSNSQVTRLSDDIATGKFPGATLREDPTPLEINYRSSGLFPAKKTLQSVDYAGELLPEILEPVIENRARPDGGQLREEAEESNDEDDSPSLRDIIDDGSGDDDSVSAMDPAEDWEEATERIYQVDQGTAGEVIWDCIRHADRVIMTIPMDDFITPVINRGNWPSYQPIQTFSGDLSTQNIREEFDIPYAENLHAYQDGYYYYADEPDRATPAEYLSWYRDLAREFRNEKEFILVGTMGDWVTEDFERENSRGLNPRISRNYSEFCRYAYNRVMLEKNVNVQDLFAATKDNLIHLLWYPIENTDPPEGDEEFRIDTSTVSAVQNDHQTLLNGAKELIERLDR